MNDQQRRPSPFPTAQVGPAQEATLESTYDHLPIGYLPEISRIFGSCAIGIGLSVIGVGLALAWSTTAALLITGLAFLLVGAAGVETAGGGGGAS